MSAACKLTEPASDSGPARTTSAREHRTFERLRRESKHVDEGHLADTLAAYSDLLGDGWDCDDVLRAWRAYADDFSASGRSLRYLKWLVTWLRAPDGARRWLRVVGARRLTAPAEQASPVFRRTSDGGWIATLSSGSMLLELTSDSPTEAELEEALSRATAGRG